MVTGHGDVSLAVQAMQAGAEGFLTKPVELAHLGAVVDRALEKAQLRDLGRAAGARMGRVSTDMLLGSSSPMRELAQQIELLARSERTVALLVGESGVGKGRVARAIHALSARGAPRLSRDRLLAAAGGGAGRSSCSAWSAASAVRCPGLFEAADGGTLFLDEIAELPDALQPTLLRALESRRVRRIGRHARSARGRAPHRRDDARPRDRGDRRTVPRGSLLPARRDAAASAAAARALAGGPARDRAGAGDGAAPRHAGRAARGPCGRGARADRLRTPGRATCASCATCSSARCSWRAALPPCCRSTCRPRCAGSGDDLPLPHVSALAGRGGAGAHRPHASRAWRRTARAPRASSASRARR